MPDPFFVSPAGLISEYNWPPYPLRGVGQAATVVPSLPGGFSILARGVGQTDLRGVGGRSGTLQVNLITPTSTGMAVAFLVDNPTLPTAYLGIALDVTSRPYALVTDLSATLVGQTASSAPAGVAGVPLQIVLSWNAITGYASLSVNGVTSPLGDWSTSPRVPWMSFTPAALLLGVGNILALNDFAPASSLLAVQLSSKPM